MSTVPATTPISAAPAEALLQIDGHAGMRREKTTEDVGQELTPDVSPDAAGVGAEFLVHLVGVRQQNARMGEERFAGGRQSNARAASLKERHAKYGLHAPETRACRRERQMRSGRARGDAAGFRHMPKRRKIAEIEARHDAFVQREGSLSPNQASADHRLRCPSRKAKGEVP